MNKRILISGCSGGGKSTLLAELKSRGHLVVDEPGRRIVTEEYRGSGQALPWVNMTSFSLRAIAMARSDLLSVETVSDFVFFDRGLVDAAVALQFASGEPYSETLGDHRHYSKIVFLAPPWPEIFLKNAERRHDFNAALEEFFRLQAALANLGYEASLLPKTPIRDRADFVLDTLKYI